MADPADKTRFSGTALDWITWVSRAMLGGLVASALYFGTWALNTESRLRDVEKFDGRIAKLEEREESYRDLATQVAVVQSQMISQSKSLDHITQLLEARARR